MDIIIIIFSLIIYELGLFVILPTFILRSKGWARRFTIFTLLLALVFIFYMYRYHFDIYWDILDNVDFLRTNNLGIYPSFLIAFLILFAMDEIAQTASSKSAEINIETPKKTKIVAGLMALVGAILVAPMLSTLILEIISIHLTIKHLFPYFITIFLGLLYIVFSFFLDKKKRWAWYGSMILDFLPVVGIIYAIASDIAMFGLKEAFFLEGYIFIFAFLLVISIPILLLLDRKNFWKIAN